MSEEDDEEEDDYEEEDALQDVIFTFCTFVHLCYKTILICL